MTNHKHPEQPGTSMTIHVYQIDRTGTITQNRGTTSVRYDEDALPEQMDVTYPPCECARCRAGQVATR